MSVLRRVLRFLGFVFLAVFIVLWVFVGLIGNADEGGLSNTLGNMLEVIVGGPQALAFVFFGPYPGRYSLPATGVSLLLGIIGVVLVRRSLRKEGQIGFDGWSSVTRASQTRLVGLVGVLLLIPAGTKLLTKLMLAIAPDQQGLIEALSLVIGTPVVVATALVLLALLFRPYLPGISASSRLP